MGFGTGSGAATGAGAGAASTSGATARNACGRIEAAIEREIMYKERRNYE
tara:strand:- start:121 stop:270 length:150 start_codon:yes stop_codon:yes gene_type:complete